MKTVFITSYHSLISRNILQTDILSILKGQNVRIVILVPPGKVDYFTGNFSGNNVEIVGMEPKEGLLDNLVYFISVCLISTENLFIQSLRRQKRYAKFYSALIIRKLFHRWFFLKRCLRLFYSSFLARNAFRELFKVYNPSLIFVTDVYHPPDRRLVAEAKKAGIRTIGMVRGWDNVISKGVLLAVPDAFISPSPIIKDELVEYNHISREKIFISGIPHYDICCKSPVTTREQFFREMKLQPEKKLIFFAPAGALLYQYDGEILKVLQKLKNEGTFKYPVQFLVRFHPGSKSNLDGFIPDSDFVFDTPGLDLVGTKKQSELTREDAERLNASLYYSDIVMTVASTIVIDGAVFDKPTIVFSFNPIDNPDDDIKKFLRDFHAHFKKFVSFGLCRVANNEDELVGHINQYLENPTLDHEKRMEIIRKYCYKIDGNSAKRVAEFILQNI